MHESRDTSRTPDFNDPPSRPPAATDHHRSIDMRTFSHFAAVSLRGAACLLLCITACGKEQPHGAGADSSASAPADTASAANGATAGATAGATGSAAPASAAGLPVIAADEAHNSLDLPGNPAIPTYSIPHGDGFILDATAYTFKPSKDAPGLTPNVAQVLFMDGGGYWVPLDTAGRRTTVTAGALRSIIGGDKSRLFVPGRQFILQVGRQDSTGGGTAPTRFLRTWVASVNIQ